MNTIKVCPKCGSENLDEFFLCGTQHLIECRDCGCAIKEVEGENGTIHWEQHLTSPILPRKVDVTINIGEPTHA